MNSPTNKQWNKIESQVWDLAVAHRERGDARIAATRLSVVGSTRHGQPEGALHATDGVNPERTRSTQQGLFNEHLVAVIAESYGWEVTRRVKWAEGNSKGELDLLLCRPETSETWLVEVHSASPNRRETTQIIAQLKRLRRLASLPKARLVVAVPFRPRAGRVKHASVFRSARVDVLMGPDFWKSLTGDELVYRRLVRLCDRLIGEYDGVAPANVVAI